NLLCARTVYAFAGIALACGNERSALRHRADEGARVFTPLIRFLEHVTGMKAAFVSGQYQPSLTLRNAVADRVQRDRLPHFSDERLDLLSVERLTPRHFPVEEYDRVTVFRTAEDRNTHLAGRMYPHRGRS